MKCYAIELPDGQYLCNHTHCWSIGHGTYNKNSRYSTSDPAEAKHYKTLGTANTQIKSQATKNKKRASTYQEYINSATVNCTNNYHARTRDLYTDSAKFVSTFKAVEVDVPTPSFVKTACPDVKFMDSKYRVGSVIRQAQGNCYCKCCGVYLKKIPHHLFGGSKSRICPFCMVERIGEAQKLLKEMDKDFREKIEAERFVHRI